MRILVTGGTGVVGRSAVTALVQRGHVVHLLSRHARRDARLWGDLVHPSVANVTVPGTLRGAAEGCDAVLHLTGIVDEQGGETFERVNVDGTRNVMDEAARAGVAKLIYVSSLGADRGESPYHRSKRRAEAIVRQFPAAWTIVRLANVYGPGDEQISLLLRMVRTLPVLPTIGSGDQPFQPIWHDDAAEALARIVERDDLAGRELELAGNEVTNQNDLVRRLARLTGREVAQVPVPQAIAHLGARLASAVGVDVPFNDSQLRMLAEGNVIAPGRERATVLLGIEPTSLDRGLEMLATAQDEQLPRAGVGGLRRKRYRADVRGATKTPEQLMEYVLAHFNDLMADLIDTAAEPASRNGVDEGATLTLSLPFRGHVQVRVAEVEPRTMTLVTIQGHPLAGAVRFLAEDRGADLRFEIQVYARAAGVVDLLMMRTLGERLEDAAWREMVRGVVESTYGEAPAGIEVETETLDDDQAERIEEWLDDLVLERKREEAGI
jgi:NADH dehydrogenase